MKKNTLLLVGAALVGYLLLKKQGGFGTALGSSHTDVIGNSEAGAPAVITTPTPAPKIIPNANLTPPMSNLLNLVQSGGTSSPQQIAAQRSASLRGATYSGVSGGVIYSVSAPHAPSARQAAAIRAAGY